MICAEKNRAPIIAQNWSLFGLADVRTRQDSGEDAFSWEVVYSGIIAGVGIRF